MKRNLRYYLFWFTILAAVGCVMYPDLHSLIVAPELTKSQILREYWPWYVTANVMALNSFLLLPKANRS